MTDRPAPRRPRAFNANDPQLEAIDPAELELDTQADAPKPASQTAQRSSAPPTSPAALLQRSMSWGMVLLSAAAGLAIVSVGLWLTDTLTAAFQRGDWIGWLTGGLMATALAALLAILFRELAGLFHMASLHKIRLLAETALRERDKAAENAATRRLTRLLAGRPDLSWPAARLRDHARDIRDPGDLLTLAERELMRPLDRRAQELVLVSARRVSIVTAVSPTGFLSVAYVLYENLRLLRLLATLYGGRPGFVGSLRLTRMVFLHVVATGGIALTDDLLGQFLGQDMLRRLSRRLGEGVFNGALTARIGVAAISIIRPLPFIEAEPPRVRNLLAEAFRNRSKDAE